MIKSLHHIIDYLLPTAIDPFPRYIIKREILNEKPSDTDIKAIHSSKWYRQLADEQWEDGSWGRFHTMASKDIKGKKFVSTEVALRRARTLGLTKDDPMIGKCIQIMERYVRGEETWTDYIEKHKDNGKGHMFCRPFLTAANINIFDPENTTIKPLRDVVAETLKTAFATGCFDENFWEQKVREYHVPSIAHPGNLYSSLLVQRTNCMDDTLQRHYLDYVWNKAGGIYYISSMPPADKRRIEDKRFFEWLSNLELLSGFSLFPEFMEKEAFQHLIHEVDRLIHDDAALPGSYNLRYAESWRDKSARKNDVILRILRVLVKC